MNSSDQATSASGSPGSAVAQGNGPVTGQPVDLSQYVPKAEFDALFSKLGEQGMELGELRKKDEELAPLISALEGNLDTARAILDGKINDQIVNDVLSGKIELKQAKEAISEAVEQVRNDMGEPQMNAIPPQDLAKLVEDAIAKTMGEKMKGLDTKIDELGSTISDVELASEIKDYVASVPDIAEYADEIEKFLEEYPDLKQSVASVKIAYDAVKGRALSEKAEKAAEEARAEAEKAAAMNSGRGSSGDFRTNSDPIIGGASSGANPNNWAN